MKLRAANRAHYTAQNTAFAEKYIDSENIVYVSKYSPLIITSLNQTEANQLAMIEQVTDIALYAPTDTSTPEQTILTEEPPISVPYADTAFTNYQSMIRSNYVSTLFSGKGIKVGMFEPTTPSDQYIEALDLTVVYPIKAPYHNSYHSEMVASIIKTVAPDVELYCASPTDPPSVMLINMIILNRLKNY